MTHHPDITDICPFHPRIAPPYHHYKQTSATTDPPPRRIIVPKCHNMSPPKKSCLHTGLYCRRTCDKVYPSSLWAVVPGFTRNPETSCVGNLSVHCHLRIYALAGMTGMLQSGKESKDPASPSPPTCAIQGPKAYWAKQRDPSGHQTNKAVAAWTNPIFPSCR